MKESKEELEKAILCLAEKYNIQESYKALFKSNTSLPTIVKNLVYELFLRSFEPYDCYLTTNRQTKSYEIIYRYCAELDENGFVEFKKDEL